MILCSTILRNILDVEIEPTEKVDDIYLILGLLVRIFLGEYDAKTFAGRCIQYMHFIPSWLDYDNVFSTFINYHVFEYETQQISFNSEKFVFKGRKHIKEPTATLNSGYKGKKKTLAKAIPVKSKPDYVMFEYSFDQINSLKFKVML
ncbi:MAG: hypothetical protein MHPSP_000379 [Paramarteilia canceri]